jgi:hypothetical protein
MRILKSHPLLKLVNNYIIDSPQPSNISYLWNFGSLLALCLIIQIITGVTLAMHYNPSVLEAFNSVEHIMRDVNNGWLLRYLHSNTASAFFFIVYLHIGKGLYYGSYRTPRTLVWTIGTVIFLLMMATAFLGYLYSPKWLELFLNTSFFFLVDISLFFNSIFNNNFFIVFYVILFTISCIFFYLNSFKLSNIIWIKHIQIFIMFMCLYSFFYAYNKTIFIDIIHNAKDINNDVNIHTHDHVTIDKDGAKAVGQGLNTIDCQWGLGATMVGVSGAVSKAIAKGGMPPLQKAGLIVGASILSGLGHSRISALNRSDIAAENITTTFVSSTNIGSHVNKLVDDSHISPLQESLFYGDLYNHIDSYINIYTNLRNK